jgi:hypothetical protein
VVQSDDTTQQRLDDFDWGSIGTELHGGLYDGADNCCSLISGLKTKLMAEMLKMLSSKPLSSTMYQS